MEDWGDEWRTKLGIRCVEELESDGLPHFLSVVGWGDDADTKAGVAHCFSKMSMTVLNLSQSLVN